MEYKNNQIKWKEEHAFIHSEDDYVFPSRNNTALGNATFYRNYHKLLRKAGLENANFHTLRHTFATRRLAKQSQFIIHLKDLGPFQYQSHRRYLYPYDPSHQKECLDKLANNYYNATPEQNGIMCRQLGLRASDCFLVALKLQKSSNINGFFNSKQPFDVKFEAKLKNYFFSISNAYTHNCC